MDDRSRMISRENGDGGLPRGWRQLPGWELSAREPHLYDYLLTLRKHQWIILSFALAVVTVVTIATFRMKPVYEAKARIEIDRENTSILPFQGNDPYDVVSDMDNYIETQSKILASETLALQTIRNTGISTHPDFAPGGVPSEAVATGNLANQNRPPELTTFLGSLTVKHVPTSRLPDGSFEAENQQ